MTMFNHKIMGSVVGLCLGGMAATAGAQSCWFLAYDVLRTEEFTVTAAERQMWFNAEKDKYDAKVTEINVMEKKKGFKKKQLLASPSYDYMAGADCARMGSDTIFETGSMMDMDMTKEAIYETFFLKPDDNNVSEEKRDDIVNKRHNYIRQLSQEVLSLSYGYRGSIAEELERLSKAPTEAKGNIQQIELMAQTKKTMVEEKAAELLFQAKLVEFDAAQMLLGVEHQYICDPDKDSSTNADWTMECQEINSKSSTK